MWHTVQHVSSCKTFAVHTCKLKEKMIDQKLVRDAKHSKIPHMGVDNYYFPNL